MDITELKQTQLALEQSEERFHTIFHSVNDLIFVHDFETGNFIEVNRSACVMLGFTRDELLKLSIGDISENRPPYTAPNILHEIKKARSGTPQTFDWRGKTKDGRLLWGRDLASPGRLRWTRCPARNGPRDFATQGS